MAKVKKMNKAQFKAIAATKYIKLKQERTEAVKDVIFNGLSAAAAEKKHDLCTGTIQRDVKRIEAFFETSVNVTKAKPEQADE